MRAAACFAVVIARHLLASRDIARTLQRLLPTALAVAMPRCLVDGDERVLAHCRLQSTCDNVDGFSAALTSVVVLSDLRGQGIGRQLLQEAEAVAAGAGYVFIYLWTHDAQVFYERCGYVDCEKTSLLRPALSLLDKEAVRKLESMLAKRAEAASGDVGQAAESVLREDSVWMRLRLLERTAMIEPLTHEQLLVGVREAIETRCGSVCKDGASAANGTWELRLATFQWERQCGPCCGIAALRMARSRARVGAEGNLVSGGAGSALLLKLLASAGASLELQVDGHAQEPGDASLLQAAISRGYSSDGEIFDIHHLAQLAADICGLTAGVVVDATASTAGEDDDGNADSIALDGGPLYGTGALWHEVTVEWLKAGGLIIAPYDNDELHYGPALRGGHRAHYALLVGLAQTSGKVFLLAVHGLSRRPLVMSPAELYASNTQLRDMKRSGNSKRWVVDDGGMRLSDRALFIWPP